MLEHRDFDAEFDARDTQRALTGTGIAVPPLSSYADKIWDYWERNLDPDLFRERSLSSAVEGQAHPDDRRLERDRPAGWR